MPLSEVRLISDRLLEAHGLYCYTEFNGNATPALAAGTRSGQTDRLRGLVHTYVYSILFFS